MLYFSIILFLVWVIGLLVINQSFPARPQRGDYDFSGVLDGMSNLISHLFWTVFVLIAGLIGGYFI